MRTLKDALSAVAIVGRDPKNYDALPTKVFLASRRPSDALPPAFGEPLEHARATPATQLETSASKNVAIGKFGRRERQL